VIPGLKGSLAAGVDLIYETLLVASLDEISSEYGLLAAAVSYPVDYSSASYRLRPEARWHDGTPVTPEDVIFSFEVFKKYNPQFSAQYLHVTKAEKTSAREITFIFDRPGNRELPQVVGRLTVLPKHWWEGADKDGRKRDMGATTLEPPLGSGPYRLKDFSAGRKVIYERVKDHWGKDLIVASSRLGVSRNRVRKCQIATPALELRAACGLADRLPRSCVARLVRAPPLARESASRSRRVSRCW
jgi:microcin C transport system substrate-binding protein